jgi:ABC transporter, permease protein
MGKRSKHELLYNIIGICIALIFLFPLYWIIVSSFKTESEIFALHPSIWPKNFTLAAYVNQFAKGDYNILKGFLNSLTVAIPATIISVMFSVPAAYGLARFRIRGKKILIHSFLLSQLMPATLLLTPMFIMFKGMGITDTFLAPIIANCTTAIPFSVMMLRPYFITMPRELEEAATMDGCSRLKTFFKIILPIGYPGIVMTTVFSFLFAWGDLIYSLTFIAEGSKRPITAGIYNYIGKYGTQWNNIMAFATVIMIPVLLIFIFLQKYIIGGLTAGAVKE